MGHVGDIGGGRGRGRGGGPGPTEGPRGNGPGVRGRTDWGGPGTTTGTGATTGTGTTTGTRPAFTEGPATSNRPGPPAEPREPALFRDALTLDNGPLVDASDTLVMPEEAPEPELPHQAMTQSTRAGNTGTRITRMPEPPNGKGQTGEAGEAPDVPGSEKAEKGPGEARTPKGKTKAPEVPPERDGFRTPAPPTGTRPALGNEQMRGPVLPVKELVPGGLEKLPNQEGVAKRFATDSALLRQQLAQPGLSAGDRAMRLWAFFAAYAEAAAAHKGTPQGGQLFDKALKEQGFAELRDARTGEDGLKTAKWVLESPKPEEARQRAEQVRLEPPPELARPETPAQQQAQQTQQPQQSPQAPKNAQDMKELPFAPQQPSERSPLEKMPGSPETMRVSPQQAEAPRPLMQPVNPQEKRGFEQLGPELQRMGGNLKKLGGNMLWNTLHLFRSSPEESAIEKEKFSQVAYGAILAFVGLALLGILLVSL